MERIAQRCIVCEEERLDGIAICEQFICQHCEQEMVHTDVQDAKYPFFIHQMRRIWLTKDA
ncbi:sigma factor G inhibitor Gin [Brevibacillus borstelensis]|uniref:sigma factor G inhibitor Gin n=1 Tax=Brevibacillus borstelensis TaxID=45462 RepID=UPI0030C13157